MTIRVIPVIAFLIAIGLLSSCGEDNRQNIDFAHVGDVDNRENFDFDRGAKSLSWQVKHGPIDLRIVPRYISKVNYSSRFTTVSSSKIAVYCDYLGRKSEHDDPFRSGTMIILFSEDDARLNKVKQSIDKEVSVDLVKNKVYAVFFSSDKVIAYTVLAEDISIP